ncbi:MAG: hypothetical protein MUC35_03710 [Candidatus Margulisbacteria bacterium]|nr:hypothetical protein [Candidatus Margulisiibacteriota bacterium]
MAELLYPELSYKIVGVLFEVFRRHRTDYRQIYGYLRRSKLELGILARFGVNGVETKRVLRGYDQ